MRVVPDCIPDPDTCPVVGALFVEGGVRFSGVNILMNQLSVGQVVLPVMNAAVESPDAYVVRNWDNLKARFEQEAVVEPAMPELAQ